MLQEFSNMKIVVLFALLAFATTDIAAQSLTDEEFVQISEDELLRIGGPAVGSIRAVTEFSPPVSSLDSGNRRVELTCGSVYSMLHPVVEFNQLDRVVSIQVASWLPLHHRLEPNDDEVASVSMHSIKDGYSIVHVVVNTPGWNADLILNDGTEQIAKCSLRPFSGRVSGIGPTDNLSAFAIEIRNERLSDSRVILSPPESDEQASRIFVVLSDFVDEK